MEDRLFTKLENFSFFNLFVVYHIIALPIFHLTRPCAWFFFAQKKRPDIKRYRAFYSD